MLLSILAARLLSIPVTSAPSECALQWQILQLSKIGQDLTQKINALPRIQDILKHNTFEAGSSKSGRGRGRGRGFVAICQQLFSL